MRNVTDSINVGPPPERHHEVVVDDRGEWLEVLGMAGVIYLVDESKESND